jgi:hypothetical protein
MQQAGKPEARGCGSGAPRETRARRPPGPSGPVYESGPARRSPPPPVDRVSSLSRCSRGSGHNDNDDNKASRRLASN